jgi:hypothetical protein
LPRRCRGTDRTLRTGCQRLSCGDPRKDGSERRSR